MGARAVTPFDGGAAPRAFLVALIAAGGLLAFTGMRPSQPWLLFFTAGAVAIAAAGIVGGSSRRVEGDLSAFGFSLLPATCTLAAGAFADQLLEGYSRAVLSAGAGSVVGLIVYAEFRSVDRRARPVGPSRLVLAGATYAGAFGVFTVMFQDGVQLAPGIAAVGMASWLLATSLLRGSGSVGMSAVLAGFAVGVGVAELRAVLYFFPTEGVLGGVLLLLGFHIATGMVHHLLDKDFRAATAAEYGLVAAGGTAAVVIASMAA